MIATRFTILFLLCLFAAVPVVGSEPTKQPNVLFIAVDDLRPELATYGAKVVTPNLDKFARTSLQFDQAYCQQAVCGASRLSIMSGLYPTHTQEQTFHIEDWRKRHPDVLTMNQHFTDNGYQTIGLGKIYHGTSGSGVDQANWSSWIRLSASGYALPENIAMVDRKLDKRGPTTEMADVKDQVYVDGQRAQKAADILKELATESDRTKPFFLAVGFTKPHLPFVAPKKYWDLYQRDQFEMPPNKGIPEGYPHYAANLPAGEMKKYADYEGKKPTDFSDALNKRLLHGYAACVSYMDANLGVVLDALKQNGLAENTIVVFWGDHGWKLGDHSTWCKHTNFECDVRVPLFIRSPGSVTGQSSKRPVELIDLYPTLCELTGLKTPAHCQGKSLSGLLKDPTADHRETAYSSYPTGAFLPTKAGVGKRKKLIGHSIRMGNFRYTEWFENEAERKSIGKRVLTNLVADPGETQNLVEQDEHAETLNKAQKLLRQRAKQAAN